MQNIDRRSWLKVSGLAGAAWMTGPAISAMPGHRAMSTNPSGLIRLSSNENPYGPSTQVRRAMQDSFENVCRYPGMFYAELVEKLAKKHGVSKDHIILTAGSTEGLKMAGITFGGAGSNIVAADPVFLALQNYSVQFGTYIHKVLVNTAMGHDLDAMEMRITQRTSLVYVCNPNNPTSALEPSGPLRSFCDTVSKRTTVFVDEAYFDYIEDPKYPTMIDLVQQGKNVIVARTFSKVYGLAGIRIGYLIARPDIVKRLGKKSMAGPNILAVAAAKAALDDVEFYKFSLEKNKVMRHRVVETLDSIGMEYVPSSCNFVFFKTGRDIKTVNEEYRKHGIKVGRAFPPMTDWCRVSMGTEEQIEQLCQATKVIFG